jgi:hypothetical protein
MYILNHNKYIIHVMLSSFISCTIDDNHPKPLFAHRECLKTDFDSFDRRYAALKRKQHELCHDTHARQHNTTQREKNSAAAAVALCEAKVMEAKTRLDNLTLTLYRVFAKYESERDTMLNGELEMVRHVMHSFYEKGAMATQFQIEEKLSPLERMAITAREEEVRQYPLQATYIGCSGNAWTKRCLIFRTG